MPENAYMPSPCIGICSTTFGDAICRGCKRYSHEIVHWNQYDFATKQIVWQRLENNRVNILSSAIIISNQQTLEKQLIDKQISFNHQQSPYWWAFDLLRVLAKASEPSHPKRRLIQAGLTLTAESQHHSIQSLYNHLNDRLYQLSQAQYERQNQLLNLS